MASFDGEFPRASLRRLDEVKSKIESAKDSIQPRRVDIPRIRQDLECAVRVLGMVQSEASLKQNTEPPSDSPRFTVLVISDLHHGADDQTSLWPSTKEHIFRGLKEDLKGGVDLVIFAGDLVNSGAAAEFDGIDVFLKDLWEQVFNTRKPPMIAVPGNHDLIRLPLDEPKTNLMRSMKDLLPANPNDESFWKQSEQRKFGNRFFEHFREWQERNLNHQRYNGTPNFSFGEAGLLVGDRSYTIIKDKIKVGVVSLNSSLLHIVELTKIADKGWAEGNLILSGTQLNAVSDFKGLRENNVNLLVTHHPFDWLTSDSAREFRHEFMRAGSLKLHICGHMHSPDFSSESTGGNGEYFQVRVPALFGQKSYFEKQKGGGGKHVERIRGYVIVELVFDGSSIQFRSRPRLLSNLRDIIPARDHCKLQDDGWTSYHSLTTQ